MEKSDEYSKTKEYFAFQIAFNDVYNLIKGKKDLGKNSYKYIMWTKEYFNDVATSLDSMLSSKKYSGNFTANYLKEILECCDKEFPETLKDVKELKNKFSSLVNKLDDLKFNPQEFYKTKDSEEIFNSLEKLISFYDNLAEIEANRQIKDDD